MTKPVAVRVEHPVRPGQPAFCRVSGAGQVGMFRSDDDGGHAISAGTFVEAPKMAAHIRPPANDIAWLVPSTGKAAKTCASLGCDRVCERADDPHCEWCIIDMTGGYG